MGDKKATKKTCFVITPIGEVGSEIRADAEGLIYSVIIPVLTEFGYDADKIAIPQNMPKPGSITNQVIERLLEDTLVVANLTGLNPNVMYELAIRHAVSKPVIMLAQEGTKLPFDILSERTVFYRGHHMAHVMQTKDAVRKVLGVAELEVEADNPVYRVKKESVVRDATVPPDAMKYLLERLDRMESAIGNLAVQIPADVFLGSTTRRFEFIGRQSHCEDGIRLLLRNRVFARVVTRELGTDGNYYLGFDVPAQVPVQVINDAASSVGLQYRFLRMYINGLPVQEPTNATPATPSPTTPP